MSNLFSGISGRFRGASNKTGSNPPKPGGGSNGSSASSPTLSSHANPSSSSLAPRISPLPSSPSLSQTISMEESTGNPTAINDVFAFYSIPRPLPLWLNNAYAKHIVKGNFLTLSATPKVVEPGEWLSHQVVEHYRMLWAFVKVIHDKQEDGHSACNSETCSRMSAGPNHSFTWLNSREEPVEVPAHEYIALMARWISGKIDDQNIFPTDPSGVSFAHNAGNPEIASSTYASGSLNTPSANTPIPAGPTTLNASLSQLSGAADWPGRSSGFPKGHVVVCQTIFRQMFRVYAHLYWAHFVDPFYHMSTEKSLNSCFSHFILTALALDMLRPNEIQPMQPLIDLWAANGTFPPESMAYQIANVQAGERLLAMASTGA